MTVLLFHVDAPFMAGGYLGVDVFFVISGFLVTRIIWDDVVHGGMSLGEFYIRRVRRLLPASLATIFVSLAVGSFLFSTSDLSDFGRSAIAALLFVPNVFFWLQSGYFDTEAIQKPLLHYWSLGVEEQFYLVWPALLIGVGLAGRKAVILLIGLIFLVSLLAAQAYEILQRCSS